MKKLFLPLLTAFLLFPSLVLALDLPVDFSKVEVNQEKRDRFSREINGVFHSLPTNIVSLKTSNVSKVIVLSPSDIERIHGEENIWGMYIPSSGEIVLNSDIYNRTDNASTTIAHELLHSFVPSGNGYNYSGSGGSGYIYEEMLVAYFSIKHYGGQTGRNFGGYIHLVDLVPKIEEVLSVAGESNPELVLEGAIFTNSGLQSINMIIDPYLTNSDFLKVLSRYLDLDEDNSDVSAANRYLNSVITTIESQGKTAEDIPENNNANTSGQSNSDSSTTDVILTSGNLDNLLSSEEGVKILEGNNLIPECIRGEGSRTANASCVTDTILFYTNILLVVVAIGSFLYMLYGALQYATAYGDDAKIVLAKKTVTYAIIGIIVAGISVLLVALVRSVLGT